MEEELCSCVNCVPSNNGSFFFDVKECNVKECNVKEKWLDTDIRELITRWKSKEILCDPTHASYHNMKERLQAVEEIRDELASDGMNFTFKQVNDKMTNLRTYYGSQKRMIDASRRQDSTNSNDVFVSRWKYFESLSFLSNTIISRSSVTSEHCSNGNETYSGHKRNHSPTSSTTMLRTSKRIRSFYPVTNNKNIKSVPDNINSDNPTVFYCNDDISNTSSDGQYANKSFEQLSQQNHKKSMKKEDTTDNSISQENVENSKTQDQIFGELITKMLSDIPEEEKKALLKLKIQHMIVCLQYNTDKPKKFSLFNNNSEDD